MGKSYEGLSQQCLPYDRQGSQEYLAGYGDRRWLESTLMVERQGERVRVEVIIRV